MAEEQQDPCGQCGQDLRYVEGGRPYSRAIGFEVDGVYDGVLYWACPFCGFAWPREFGSVTLNYKSQQAVDDVNARVQTR